MGDEGGGMDKMEMIVRASPIGGDRSRMALQLAGEDAAKRMRVIAEGIFDDYHHKFPTIKQFNNRVYRVVKNRKWVKGLYGRRYIFDPARWETEKMKRSFGPHRAVNYIIQGSCSDLMRKKIVEVC